MDFGSLFHSVLGNVLFWGIAAISGAIAGYLKTRKDKRLAPVLTGLFAMGVAALVFLDIAMWNNIRTEQASKTTTENVQSKIRIWLDEFNVPSQNLKDDDAYFHYSVTVIKDPELGVNVVRPKAHGSALSITARLYIKGESSISVVENLTEAQRQKLSADLFTKAAMLGLGCLIDDSLKQCAIELGLPIAGLTEMEFMKALRSVTYGIQVLQATYWENLHSLVPAKQKSIP